MNDFPERFIALRDRLEAALDPRFERRHSVDCLGRIAALRADFHAEAESKIFGIMPNGRTSHCHEYRLLFAAPMLTEEALEDWWKYAVQLQDELIVPDENHEFSLISLILVTDNLSRPLEKKLKRMSSERQYKEGGNTGWSSVRLAAVDLSRSRAFANAMGAPLRDIIKKEL